MKISVDSSKRTSVVTLTMTLSQLNTIRYALAEGVGKLASHASYMRIMAKHGDVIAKKMTKDVTRIAKESKLASEALENVTRKWATGWIEERRGGKKKS